MCLALAINVYSGWLNWVSRVDELCALCSLCMHVWMCTFVFVNMCTVFSVPSYLYISVHYSLGQVLPLEKKTVQHTIHF